MAPTYKGITVLHPTIPEMITGVLLVTLTLTRVFLVLNQVIAILVFLHQVIQLTVTARQVIHQVLWVIIQPQHTAQVLITVRLPTALTASQPIHLPTHFLQASIPTIVTTVIHGIKI